MADYDDDNIVDLSGRYPHPANLRLSNRQKVMMFVDGDIAEAVVSLSDYFVPADRQRVIEQAFSILLLSLINDSLDEPEITTDSFERMVSNHTLGPNQISSRLWGEIMTLSVVFHSVYEYEYALHEGLEDLLAGTDLRIFAEEMFQVRWSKGAQYLLIE